MTDTMQSLSPPADANPLNVSALPRLENIGLHGGAPDLAAASFSSSALDAVSYLAGLTVMAGLGYRMVRWAFSGGKE